MAKRPPISRADRLFRACSDCTRLGILRLLQGGEMCVCDLVTALRVPQPTASRHLAYLRRCGLVAARKQGLWSYYKLSEPRDDLHRALLACVSCCGDTALGRRGSRGCCC